MSAKLSLDGVLRAEAKSLNREKKSSGVKVMRYDSLGSRIWDGEIVGIGPSAFSLRVMQNDPSLAHGVRVM